MKNMSAWFVYAMPEFSGRSKVKDISIDLLCLIFEELKERAGVENGSSKEAEK